MGLKEEFLLKAYDLDIVKFGEFVLKSGIKSPFYVDLRPLSSNPKMLKELSFNLLALIKDVEYDLICGVPYAALPIATAMALEEEKTLIIKRKEAKKYGTKKVLEGIFLSGQKCILVEDVVTSGKSLLETIDEIEKEGLVIRDIVVVLDREQGGVKLLEEKGYRVHTLFSIQEVVDILYKKNMLDVERVKEVKDFINTKSNVSVGSNNLKKKSYEEKLKKQKHKVGRKLLEITIEKKSNLIASIDLTRVQDILNMAEEIGDYIVALKLHTDIIEDFSLDYVKRLKEISKRKNFLLLEDRKFADIGNTQHLQFEKGMYKISDWADMITSHVIGGEDSLKAFDSRVGVITILEMSSKGALTVEGYKQKSIEISQKIENVIGGVAQSRLPEDLLLFTPGVNFTSKGDEKGQQFNSPIKVISQYNTDFLIVGRGIYNSKNPKQEALKYKEEGWSAYIKSL